MTCFRCGGKHFVKHCTFDIKSICGNMACYYCYDIFSRRSPHSPTECILKRRLKCMFLIYFHQVHVKNSNNENLKEYGKFLGYALSSDENWYGTLNKLACLVRKRSREEMIDDCSTEMLHNDKIHPMTIVCEQINDNDPRSPLLPPTHILQSEELGSNPLAVHTSVNKLEQNFNFTDADHARSIYCYLRQQYKSNQTRRNFVHGFVYKTILNGCYFLTQEKINQCQTVRLEITLTCGKTSDITITTAINQEDMLQSIVQLGKKLPMKGNCRQKVGDHGECFVLGVKDWSKKEVYGPTGSLRREIKKVSTMVGPWLRTTHGWFQEHLTNEIEKKGRIVNHYPMVDGPCSTFIMSKNYGNASHYDIYDSSMTFGIWVEENPSSATNWYFILPNVSYNGSNGIAIEIVHGRCIIWDGKVIRHCTSVADIGTNNNVYGVAFLSSNH